MSQAFLITLESFSEGTCYRKPQMLSPIFNNRHQTLQRRRRGRGEKGSPRV